MERSSSSDAADVLVAVADPADARLLQRAFEDASVDDVSVALDGDDVLAQLTRSGDRASLPPRLVVLDLDLPRPSGTEILSTIKDDPELRRIPVIVLTECDEDDALHTSYALHANASVVKPPDYDGVVELVESICRFWLSTARLPPRS